MKPHTVKLALTIAMVQPLFACADEVACSHAPPPIEAVVTENHGEYLFFYPKSLGNEYTGCQAMWNEKGEPLITLVFKAGKLLRYEAARAAEKGGKDICIYRDEKLAQGAADVCPDYEDARNGFRAVADATYLLVPPGRDPRRKSHQ